MNLMAFKKVLEFLTHRVDKLVVVDSLAVLDIVVVTDNLVHNYLMSSATTKEHSLVLYMYIFNNKNTC